MFEKKSVLSVSPPVNEDRVHTIIGKEASFNGKLTFDGTLRIDGRFTGEVFSQGKLIIGDDAVVEGQIDTNIFISSGDVKGDVTAKTRIELKAPGKLRGNIKAPLLIIDEGVMFEGHSQMENIDKGRDAKEKITAAGKKEGEGKKTG